VAFAEERAACLLLLRFPTQSPRDSNCARRNKSYFVAVTTTLHSVAVWSRGQDTGVSAKKCAFRAGAPILQLRNGFLRSVSFVFVLFLVVYDARGYLFRDSGSSRLSDEELHQFLPIPKAGSRDRSQTEARTKVILRHYSKLPSSISCIHQYANKAITLYM
jgi:hypothetical protein